MSEISHRRLTTATTFAYNLIIDNHNKIGILDDSPILDLYRLQGAYDVLSRHEKAAFGLLCPKLHELAKIRKRSLYGGEYRAEYQYIGFNPDDVAKNVARMKAEQLTLTSELKASWPFVAGELEAWLSSAERIQAEEKVRARRESKMKTTCPICGRESESESGNKSHIKACFSKWRAGMADYLKANPDVVIEMSDDYSTRGLVPIMRSRAHTKPTWGDRVRYKYPNGKPGDSNITYGQEPYTKRRWKDVSYLGNEWVDEKEYRALREKEDQEYREQRARELAERKAKEALSN